MPDKLKKALRKTSDPVKSGSAGSGKITKTNNWDKLDLVNYGGTKIKKTASNVRKAVGKLMGYSKGGLIQHD